MKMLAVSLLAVYVGCSPGVLTVSGGSEGAGDAGPDIGSIDGEVPSAFFGSDAAAEETRCEAACPTGMLLIPGGEYIAPTGEQVAVSPFCLGTAEVTVGEYRGCVVDGACEAPVGTDAWCRWTEHPQGGELGTEYHPMNCISMGHMEQYMAWTNTRLPHFHEWAKAVRGGCEVRGEPGCEPGIDEPLYPWGETRPACGLACMAAPGGRPGCGWGGTQHVCKHANGNSPYGVCDGVGSVYEPTADCDANAGTCRFYGGSFADTADALAHFAVFTDGNPRRGSPLVGFRVAADVDVDCLSSGE